MKRIIRYTGLGMCVCMLFLALFGMILPVRAAEEVPVLSYGLQVLSSRTDVAMSERIGNDILLTSDRFARGMNVSSVKYITVRSLPPTTAGELLLGSSRVVVGQTISAANMEYLTFSAASDMPIHTSFLFSVNDSPVATACNLYLLNTVNYVPTVSMAPELFLKVSTYRGMNAYGVLSAYDADGDELIYEIVSYPEKGCLTLTDRTLGTYVYKPNADFVGRDRFVYVARDRYGNYSTSATVEVTVEQSGTSLVYSDMQGHESAYDALSLYEAGIMKGEQVGGDYYFYPSESVSRVEFLVMAMNAAGIRNLPDAEEVGFFDDGEIPDSMKGYVAAAYRMGYITGTLKEGKLCFFPNACITRAEAAVILCNILDPEEAAVIPVFSDGGEIPTWAGSSIYALNAAGILCSREGRIAPASELTRSEAAEILSATLLYEKLN